MKERGGSEIERQVIRKSVEGEEGKESVGSMKRQGEGWREREERQSVKSQDHTKRPKSERCHGNPPRWPEKQERGPRAAGLFVAELTYIDLTENNVYYAANHNQGVEHIPGIPEIALSEAQRAAGKLEVRSKQTQDVMMKFM